MCIAAGVGSDCHCSHSKYLFDAIGCCQFDDDLCSLLVEIAAITTKTYGLPLDLITQRVEQRLNPAYVLYLRWQETGIEVCKRGGVCNRSKQLAIQCMLLSSLEQNDVPSPVGEVVFACKHVCFLPETTGPRLLSIDRFCGLGLDL